MTLAIPVALQALSTGHADLVRIFLLIVAIFIYFTMKTGARSDTEVKEASLKLFFFISVESV